MRKTGETIKSVEDGPSQVSSSEVQNHQDQPAASSGVAAPAPEPKTAFQFLVESGVDEAQARLMVKYEKLYQSVQRIGFTVVELKQEEKYLDFLLRVKPNLDNLFPRLQGILRGGAGIDLGKRYVLKSGSLAYGWYIRIPVASADLARDVLDKVYYNHPEKPASKIPGGNPVGKIARSGVDIPNGSGVGVTSTVLGGWGNV